MNFLRTFGDPYLFLDLMALVLILASWGLLEPLGLDSGFLEPPGLDSGLLGAPGLDSGLLGAPGLDFCLLGTPGAILAS